MRATRRLALLGAATALLLSGTGVATADQIYNNLDNSIDAVAEVMPLNVGGPNGTTTLAVNPVNGDGKSGCNLTGSTTLTVSVASTDATVATVSPSSVTFTSCSDTHQLTVTPVDQGSATVSLNSVSNSTGGSFDLSPATFTVNVTEAAPANTAPKLSMDGATDGGSYAKGSVPTTTCTVIDAEDAPNGKSVDVKLSDITGPYSSDGIGSQTASCSYTDAGGLTASSSVTYNIVDPSAPVIGYMLNPAAPDGANGWYKGDVTLTWNVTEEESPSSLSTSGCDKVTVNTDQLRTDYTCSASSAGGDATPVTVTIKRDGNGPSVDYDQFISGTAGNNGWYTSDVTVQFKDADNFSGVVDATQTISTNGEGTAVTVDSPAFSDNAGNVTAAGAATSPAFKIDKTAPTDITFSGVPSSGDYVYGQVTAPSCSASDGVSGVTSCVVTGDESPNSIGTHTWTATATNGAGLTSTATQTYHVVYRWDGFLQPINDTAHQVGTSTSIFKAGSTVPVKFQLKEADGTVVQAAAAPQWITPVKGSGTSAPVDETSYTVTGDTGSTYRYDATTQQYIYNWKTDKTQSGSYYRIGVKLDDGTTQTVIIGLR